MSRRSESGKNGHHPGTKKTGKKKKKRKQRMREKEEGGEGGGLELIESFTMSLKRSKKRPDASKKKLMKGITHGEKKD